MFTPQIATEVSIQTFGGYSMGVNGELILHVGNKETGRLVRIIDKRSTTKECRVDALLFEWYRENKYDHTIMRDALRIINQYGAMLHFDKKNKTIILRDLPKGRTMKAILSIGMIPDGFIVQNEKRCFWKDSVALPNGKYLLGMIVVEQPVRIISRKERDKCLFSVDPPSVSV